MDKELKALIRRLRQEKYVKLLMCLTQIEDKYDIDIKKFNYDNGVVLANIEKDDWVRVDLNEVENDRKQNTGPNKELSNEK